MRLWRAYYDRNYVNLLFGIYYLSRFQVRFSPLDSLKIAASAAAAAFVFKRSRSRQEAQAALPFLTCYFQFITQGSPSTFDPEEVAKLELDWWQARREASPASNYSSTIAWVSANIYGVDASAIQHAAFLRAQAMEYRDTRRRAMTDQDWKRIEEMLISSYKALQTTINCQRKGSLA